MSFHSTPCHIELGGNFGVIASLQEQVYDLLFARTEPNSLLFHPILPFFGFASPEEVRGLFLFLIASTLPTAELKHRLAAKVFSTGTCGLSW